MGTVVSLSLYLLQKEPRRSRLSRGSSETLFLVRELLAMVFAVSAVVVSGTAARRRTSWTMPDRVLAVRRSWFRLAARHRFSCPSCPRECPAMVTSTLRGTARVQNSTTIASCDRDTHTSRVDNGSAITMMSCPAERHVCCFACS